MFLKEQYIFHGVLSFLWLEFLWELYLLRRQRKIYKQVKTVPQELQEVISEETFENARLYGLNRNGFRIVMDTISIIITTETLLYDGISFFWELSKSVMAGLGCKNYNEILVSVVFVLITNTLGELINLPFSIYSTFVLEEKFGFNKQTFELFMKDQLKAFVVGHIIALPIIVIFIYILKIGGDYFFMYLCLFTLVSNFIVLVLYPDYIAPLFDNNKPLPDGNLKRRIEELADSIGFPLYKVYVVEASKRSGHSNAYLYGFSNSKRIVLYDTLLKDLVPENESTSQKAKKGCNDDEVLAVLSHELGHWKLNHSQKIIIIMLVNLLLVFYIFVSLYKYRPMYYAFGFYDEKPALIGLLIVIDFIISPYMVVLGFLLNILSRHFEFEADAFVGTLGKSQFLRSALIKLYTDNLIYPVYDTLYSTWHHSHPPLLERLRAIKDKED